MEFRHIGGDADGTLGFADEDTVLAVLHRNHPAVHFNLGNAGGAALRNAELHITAVALQLVLCFTDSNGVAAPVNHGVPDPAVNRCLDRIRGCAVRIRPVHLQLSKDILFAKVNLNLMRVGIISFPNRFRPEIDRFFRAGPPVNGNFLHCGNIGLLEGINPFGGAKGDLKEHPRLDFALCDRTPVRGQNTVAVRARPIGGAEEAVHIAGVALAGQENCFCIVLDRKGIGSNVQSLKVAKLPSETLLPDWS